MTDKPRPHLCHAHDCNVEIPPRLLMCLGHWRKVPHSLQEKVYAYFRSGKRSGRHPTPAWMIAANMAVLLVAKKEGYDVRRYDKSLELWIRKAREEGGPENVEAISMVARWEKAAGDYRSGDLFGRSEDRAAL